MSEKLFCANCGKELNVDSNFCPGCGAKVERQEEEAKMYQVNEDIKVENENEVEKENALINILEKIPDRPPIRKRIMWGFMFVAGIFLLTGYVTTALFMGAAGLLLHDKIYSKATGVKKGIVLIGVIVCFCIGMVSFEIKELDNEYISVVQEGSFTAYPNSEIGVAFERFFDDAEWFHIVTDDGIDVVEFTGKCTYDGVVVDVLMQFTIAEDKSFEVTYLSYNDVTQNRLEMASLLGAVFSEYR